MSDLAEWAYRSGRDRGWDAADRELTDRAETPEAPKIPRAYTGNANLTDQFRRGWLYGIALRKSGCGVHGDPLDDSPAWREGAADGWSNANIAKARGSRLPEPDGSRFGGAAQQYVEGFRYGVHLFTSGHPAPARH